MKEGDWVRLFWKLIDAAIIVLALNCAYSAAQNWIYLTEGRELRDRLEKDSRAVNQIREEVSGLVGDAVKYAKRDPGILPVLRSHGIESPAP